MTSGVYQILNTVNGKCYVGSSKNIESRWGQHRSMLDKGTHHNQKLSNAVSKHGIAAFEFSILEGCPPEKNLDRELFWITQSNSVASGYNMRWRPDSNLGVKHSQQSRENMGASRRGKKLSPEHCKKISDRMKLRDIAPMVKASADARRGVPLSEERRAEISASLTGKPKSPEHTAKVAAAHTGTKRSEATRARISEVQKGRKLTPEQHAARFGVKRTPESIEKRVAKMRGVPQSTEHIAKRVAKCKATKAAKKQAALQAQLASAT
jgi:group I intron endonuclease